MRVLRMCIYFCTFATFCKNTIFRTVKKTDKPNLNYYLILTTNTMKKLFTLLLALASVSISLAIPSRFNYCYDCQRSLHFQTMSGECKAKIDAAGEKATKNIVNGVLLIEKNDQIYNVIGLHQ